ncbi:MAG: hypothetical protein PHY73_00365 [Candidatus Omnitrophica bacterium]|nr:hypothetical protein [Candidatus Omnitrophota bacterium]
MKKIIFTILFVVACCSLAFADKVTLTTYYPAPFGMYQEMRVMGQLGVGEENPIHKVEIVPDAGQGALVAGSGNTATNASVAFGLNNTTTGNNSFTSGESNNATGNYSTAFGSENTVSGTRSFASGFQNNVAGDNASAFGGSNSVSGSYSFAAGNANVASGKRASVFGQASFASGDYSFASGQFANARAKNSAVFGQYNIVSGTTNAWVDTDPLFVIGNGASAANRSNAVTVLKNGRTGIGTETPFADLHVQNTDFNYSAVFENTAAAPDGPVIEIFNDAVPRSVTTKSGIYMETSADTAYGIYQTGGGDNYFAGDVGIGKTAPQAHLHVNAQGSAEGVWIKSEAANSSSGLSFVSGGTNDRYNIFSNQGNLTFARYRNGAGQTDSNFMVIDDQGWPNGGRLGIGITVPQAKLDVNGAIKVGTEGTACSDKTAGMLKFTPIEKVVCATGTVQTSTLRLCSTDDNGANWKWYLVHGDWNEVCSPSPSPIE